MYRLVVPYVIRESWRCRCERNILEMQSSQLHRGIKQKQGPSNKQPQTHKDALDRVFQLAEYRANYCGRQDKENQALKCPENGHLGLKTSEKQKIRVLYRKNIEI